MTGRGHSDTSRPFVEANVSTVGHSASLHKSTFDVTWKCSATGGQPGKCVGCRVPVHHSLLPQVIDTRCDLVCVPLPEHFTSRDCVSGCVRSARTPPMQSARSPFSIVCDLILTATCLPNRSYDALSAKMLAKAGHKSAFVSGYAVSPSGLVNVLMTAAQQMAGSCSDPATPASTLAACLHTSMVNASIPSRFWDWLCGNPIGLHLAQTKW